MSANFKYGFNIVVASILGFLSLWVFDLTAKETIVLIGLLAIVYNQHEIMRSLEDA